MRRSSRSLCCHSAPAPPSLTSLLPFHSNTPTLAAMLRVSKRAYSIARRYLYQVVELGYEGRRSLDSETDGFFAGLNEQSERKLESLALIRTLFLKCKFRVDIAPPLRHTLFPNLDTLILPVFATLSLPSIFSLDLFHRVKHLVVLDFLASPHLFHPVDTLKASADVSQWSNIRKLSLYNFSNRYRGADVEAMRKKRFTLPQAWKSLEEVVVWPSFDGTDQETSMSISPFLLFPDIAALPAFTTFTVIVSDHDAAVGAACEAAYRSMAASELSVEERGRVRYIAGMSVEKTRRDPVLDEVSSYREWL